MAAGLSSYQCQWGEIVFLQFLCSSPSAWWGRSAGPDFSAMRNRGKNRQRRGLPPPCGIHPAGTGCACVPLRSALGPVGSHGWCKLLGVVPASLAAGTSTPRALPWCAAVPSCGEPGFRRWEHRISPSRPGGWNHLAIGPAAQGSLGWWQN